MLSAEQEGSSPNQFKKEAPLAQVLLWLLPSAGAGRGSLEEMLPHSVSPRAELWEEFRSPSSGDCGVCVCVCVAIDKKDRSFSYVLGPF